MAQSVDDCGIGWRDRRSRVHRRGDRCRRRAVIEHGFPAQSWLTFRQALALGGHVRKGEHGTTVVYADRFVPDDEKRRARETGEDAQAIPFLKRFTLFNAAQCENLPADVAAVAPPPTPGLIEPRVEALCRATGIIGWNYAVLSNCRHVSRPDMQPAFTRLLAMNAIVRLCLAATRASRVADSTCR
jgi:hypothetical protein